MGLGEVPVLESRRVEPYASIVRAPGTNWRSEEGVKMTVEANISMRKKLDVHRPYLYCLLSSR